MGTLERPAGRAEREEPGESTAQSDAKLVAAILRRDRKATAEFVARFADWVYAYVHSRLAPRADLVDDVVQEVFLAAWRGLSSFEATSSLQAWLLGIARHKVEDHYRACLRAPGRLDELEANVGETSVDARLDELMDSVRLSEKSTRILQSLEERYRVALVWRYWEKVPAKEMAARTGATEKAVERLLARAREQFKRRWNDE